MGQVTPYIGIYIPVEGETNYGSSFAAGMMNIDQHDHSGGPNKGVPITNSGLANFSVTYNKLNANVVDPTTGIGVKGAPLQNQIEMLGVLKNLYALSLVPGTGFVSMNGPTVNARTIQDTATITWTNPDGISGNPSADVDPAALGVFGVDQGGTGLSTLNPYELMAAGTTNTGNMQQIASGSATEVLTSNGPGVLPSFQAIPYPTQNILTVSTTLTDSDFKNLSTIRRILIPAQGAGTVIVVYRCWAKLNYAGVTFGSGSSVRLYWSTTSNEVGFVFTSGSFKDSYNAYYSSDITDTSSSIGYTLAEVENRNVVIGVNSSDFNNGAGNTVTFWASYSVMSI